MDFHTSTIKIKETYQMLAGVKPISSDLLNRIVEAICHPIADPWVGPEKIAVLILEELRKRNIAHGWVTDWSFNEFTRQANWMIKTAINMESVMNAVSPVLNYWFPDRGGKNENSRL